MISIGISSYNIRSNVPTDLPTHNQYIASNNLKAQEYLNSISEWTNKQKMKLNIDKSKIMIFNFTQNYQFTTRVSIDNTNLEVVNETKLLGTHNMSAK